MKLYHASDNKNIKVLQPQMKSVRNNNEGPVVFATPNLALASCFIVNVDDSWADMGRFNDVVYFICNDEIRFKQADKGGTIYVLDSDGFEADPNKGMGLNEWINKNSVVPKDKIEYKSGLQAMIENNVKIFFVDPKKFDIIMNSEDELSKILEQ